MMHWCCTYSTSCWCGALTHVLKEGFDEFEKEDGGGDAKHYGGRCEQRFLGTFDKVRRRNSVRCQAA